MKSQHDGKASTLRFKTRLALMWSNILGFYRSVAQACVAVSNGAEIPCIQESHVNSSIPIYIELVLTMAVQSIDFKDG